MYLFSCSGRLLSSVRCDKETRDEHQTKKARALGKSENISWNIYLVLFFHNFMEKQARKPDSGLDIAYVLVI